MLEIKEGVQLKRTETLPQKTSIWNSHDFLMNDIRAKRAVLKPPDPDTSPQVEIEARDVILNYIKSKPQLKAASERILKDPVIEETPVEKLMSDIRTGKARQSLRRTKTRLRHSTLAESWHVGKVRSNHVSSQGDEDEDADVFDDILCQPKQDLNLEEVGTVRTQLKKAERDLEGIDLGKVCFNCGITKFNLFNWSYTCQICTNEMCKRCCTKIKLPSINLSDIYVSSLTTQFDDLDGKDQNENKEETFSRNSALRGSLKFPNKKESPRFSRSRSKTLTKVQSREAEKSLRSNLHESNRHEKHVNTTICLECKSLIASIIWGKKKSPKKRVHHDLSQKKSPESYQKKSIMDIQAMTISKRKSLIKFH